MPQEQQYTSSITLGEFVYGARRHKDRAEVLLQRIDEIIPANLAILPFDAAAARRYGEIRAESNQHYYTNTRAV